MDSIDSMNRALLPSKFYLEISCVHSTANPIISSVDYEGSKRDLNNTDMSSTVYRLIELVAWSLEH
jgi:hypothetical protein